MSADTKPASGCTCVLQQYCDCYLKEPDRPSVHVVEKSALDRALTEKVQLQREWQHEHTRKVDLEHERDAAIAERDGARRLIAEARDVLFWADDKFGYVYKSACGPALDCARKLNGYLLGAEPLLELEKANEILESERDSLRAELDWSLKNESKYKAALSERLEQIAELQREVERLRSALELALGSTEIHIANAAREALKVTND